MTGPLRAQLTDYLVLRRALGYHLARPEKLLGQFLDHLEGRGEPTITVATALGWARLPANGDSNWWAYRLSVVRGFAGYLHALDPAHEVPAPDLLPQRPLRANPYLYSDAEIAALIAATAGLRTVPRRAMFATLIGLLAVTGMRVGEAIGLDRADVDLTAGMLLVRSGKFGKRRELVLHPSSIDALQRYQRLRDQVAEHGHGSVLRLHRRHPADLLQRPPHVPPARPRGRTGAALVDLPAPDPRPPSFVRGPRHARRLRRRRQTARPG